MEVTERPDGGGWPLEKGIVHEGRGSLDGGWFRLVNARHPDGIGCHTQEVYPPGFTGCTLPCCLHVKPFQNSLNWITSSALAVPMSQV